MFLYQNDVVITVSWSTRVYLLYEQIKRPTLIFDIFKKAIKLEIQQLAWRQLLVLSTRPEFFDVEKIMFNSLDLRDFSDSDKWHLSVIPLDAVDFIKKKKF